MMQNIGFSLAIIGVLIPLAATGVLGLATVVFVHELAEVLVIANAIRAARTKALPGAGAVPRVTPGKLNISVAAYHDTGDACCAPVSATTTDQPRPVPEAPLLPTPRFRGAATSTSCAATTEPGCSCCSSPSDDADDTPSSSPTSHRERH